MWPYLPPCEAPLSPLESQISSGSACADSVAGLGPNSIEVASSEDLILLFSMSLYISLNQKYLKSVVSYTNVSKTRNRVFTWKMTSLPFSKMTVFSKLWHLLHIFLMLKNGFWKLYGASPGSRKSMLTLALRYSCFLLFCTSISRTSISTTRVLVTHNNNMHGKQGFM